MTRSQFFKHLELLADQPDAVAKMRGLVLELAVRGRLVNQTDSDGNADALLAKIRKERERLVGAKEIRKFEEAKTVSESDELFALPPSWRWCRLETLCTQITDGAHFTPTYVPKGVPFLSVKDVTGGKIDFTRVRFIPRKEHEELTKRCKPEYFDILFTKVGTTGIARVIDTREEFSIFVSLALLKFPQDCVAPYFLELLLNSPVVRQQSADNTQGVGNKNLVLKSIKSFLVPLPPLAEQRRIVAKVDELMALCDELEQRQQARQQASGLLQQSALHHLLAAREPQTFAAAWQRVRDHFHVLHDTPDAIPQLRQAILQLAVQGRLVPQNPKDEPAENKFGRNEELSANAPFEIPEQWTWTQLSQLADINGGFAFKSTDYTDEGTRVIRISDFDEFGFKDHKVVRHPFTPDLQKFMLAEFNILMAMTGGTVGKSYFVKSLPEPMVVNQRVATIKVSAIANPSYVDIAIRSEMTQEVIRKAKNSTNDNISMVDIKGFAIPFPPLAEQKRIVARVEELLRWCDTLESQLHQTRTLGVHLLASTLHHLLAA